MKPLLLLLSLSTISNLNAQNSEEVRAWTSTHPNVYIVEYDTYNTFSEEMKNKIAGNVIVYQDVLNMELLESYDQMKAVQQGQTNLAKDAERQEIKDWLGTHQDVKLIKRSEFNLASDDRQAMILASGALVMLGDELTVEDIRNY